MRLPQKDLVNNKFNKNKGTIGTVPPSLARDKEPRPRRALQHCGYEER